MQLPQGYVIQEILPGPGEPFRDRLYGFLDKCFNQFVRDHAGAGYGYQSNPGRFEDREITQRKNYSSLVVTEETRLVAPNWASLWIRRLSDGGIVLSTVDAPPAQTTTTTYLPRINLDNLPSYPGAEHRLKEIIKSFEYAAGCEGGFIRDAILSPAYRRLLDEEAERSGHIVFHGDDQGFEELWRGRVTASTSFRQTKIFSNTIEARDKMAKLIQRRGRQLLHNQL